MNVFGVGYSTLGHNFVFMYNLIFRAKRPSKHLIKLAKEHAIGKDRFPGPNTVRSIKNMRKSRTGYGRGLAKKR